MFFSENIARSALPLSRPRSLRHDFAKQNFKNLANLANKVNLCKKNYGLLTKLARLARFLKFCFACKGGEEGRGELAAASPQQNEPPHLMKVGGEDGT
ncbi:MAG: hypothetical protein IJ699_09485, partial [Bacteroidaceae bacterium]|nr:hypothetical protein [Bacteroidaceae bacterium]